VNDSSEAGREIEPMLTFADKISTVLSGDVRGITILDQPDPLTFSSLDRAVVVLHAPWSGPSVMVVKGYTAAYRKFSEHASHPVDFYILNFDSLSESYWTALPGRFGGNGETFLVNAGKIVCNLPHFTQTFSDQLSDAFPPTR